MFSKVVIWNSSWGHTDYDILVESVQNTTQQIVMLLYEDLVYREPLSLATLALQRINSITKTKGQRPFRPKCQQNVSITATLI